MDQVSVDQRSKIRREKEIKMGTFSQRNGLGFQIHVCTTIILFFIVVNSSAYLFSGISNSNHKRHLSRKEEQHYNNSGSQLQSKRDPKFFPILSFVTLPSATCQTDSGSVGACMKSSKCQRQGGMASGSCGMSFGVCCVINKVCSGNGNIDTVTLNGTHLLNPAQSTELCRYEIPRQAGVCQIRLDFNEFNIDQGPDAQTFGDCSTDTFTVSGASNGIVGPLCGDLKGQHMYLDYGTSDKINLDFFLQSSMSQKWDIAVTMIRCDSLDRAPTGCLQFYTTQTGMVKSLNYNNMVQLNNQDYTVCVRAQVGMRKITWKPCMTNPATTTDFIISGGPPGANPGGGNAAGIPLSGDSCNLDWVMVLGQNKYCGSQFPDSVSSTSQPFILQVHFNEFELPPPPPCTVPPPYACPGVNPDDPNAPQPDALNTGFCLRYSQSPF